MQFDLVISGGTVVTAADSFAADVAVNGGAIVAVGANLAPYAAQVLDASGKYVLPGGIDVHTHLEMPFGGTVSKDTFETGSIAAAVGGTTSFIDFCIQAKGQSLRQALEGWHAKADGRSCVDYGFHVAVTDMTADVLAEMPRIIDAGYPSFKVFLTYDGLRVNDGVFIQSLEAGRDHGGLTMVHAENYYAIKHLTARLLAQGLTAPRHHAESRPPIVEGEATGRAVKLAQLVNGPLYVVHLSCNDALEEVARGRAAGAPVMAETCPQYLLLSTDNYDEPDFGGAKYVMSPPLRPKAHQEPLWKGLAGGSLCAVATDHCPFDFHGQKDMGRDSFVKIPNGGPGIETRMMLLFHYGVNMGRMSLPRFVEVTSTNPAKAFGLYPRKGLIAPGADADLVIWDPAAAATISKPMLHENVDYTAYEGFPVVGLPAATLVAGKVVAQGGKWVGQKGQGRFLKRGAPMMV